MPLSGSASLDELRQQRSSKKITEGQWNSMLAALERYRADPSGSVTWPIAKPVSVDFFALNRAASTGDDGSGGCKFGQSPPPAKEKPRIPANIAAGEALWERYNLGQISRTQDPTATEAAIISPASATRPGWINVAPADKLEVWVRGPNAKRMVGSFEI